MKKFVLFYISLLTSNLLNAQCNAPGFSVNLTAQEDTTWTLVNTTRGGTCCGSNNCVTFTVTTNPNSELISFDVTNPSPSGSAFYQVNCGAPISIGTPLCIVGLPSPFTITYCKPGGDSPNYIITAGTVVHASTDISIHKTGCVDTLEVSNVLPSSVVWTSIFPGVQGAYDSYLSCTTGCTSTLVTPGPNPPAYVDYQVSGSPNTTCGAAFDKDTVRVYFVPNLTGTITPVSAVICASSGTSIILTANASGGATPYNYSWSTGPNSQSINVNSAGSYTVVIGDKTKCPKISLIKTITAMPSATFGYTGSGYCKNGVNPTPNYSGGGQAGVFSASPAGLTFVSTSTGEINLSASIAGTYTVTNFIAASNGCPNVSATTIITIYPFPVMTSASTATICTGGTVNIPLTSSSGATYTWQASDNTNTTGESLTTQTTATVNNTITNAAFSIEQVIYTVTPTSTGAGACSGVSQTLTVTVIPKDNASFTYSNSTFCQTGTNPTPTVTGIAGGSFSSTVGLVFANTSTGVINLSASTVGSYTITYTSNGPCPNTATFPITITTAPSAAFSFAGSPYCQNEPNPFPTFSPGASGGTFTSSGGLVFVNNQTGEVSLSASTPGTYTVTNTIAAASGCAAATATASIVITELKNPAFTYTASPYCQNAVNPSPAFSGGAVAGTFTSTAGLNINSGTGLINLSLSTPGTYTVTNTIAATGGCPAVNATGVLTITALPVATFTYNGSPFCDNGADPSPVFTGGGVAGVFSASSVFLNINSSTGTIDLSASTAGGYIITNTIPAANGCPLVSATTSVTITDLPTATFNFTANPYCQNGADPTPVLSTGGSNGIYTSTPAGLTIDSNAGTVDLSASTVGTYTVTNTITASGGCPVVIASSTIAITALPIGTFNYTGNPYCPNQANPSPTFTGGGVAGTFSAPAGLTINTTTGQVNLSLSIPGTYTVTNMIAAASGCPSVIEQISITITPMDDPGFGYPGSTFCQTGIDPSPNVTGLPGGTFSSTGITVNAGSGVVDLSSAGVGTYTIGYTTAGACPSSSTLNITVTNAPSAAFSYVPLSFCTTGSDPLPVYPPGSSAGIYSSVPGLIIDSLSGTIDLSASTPGNYTVTNTIAASGGCAVATANTAIVIDMAATVNANTNQVICFGNPVTLNGVLGGSATGGTWTGGAGSYSPGPFAPGATYIPNSADSLAGIITLTLTTNDPAGVCPAVNDTMSIIIAQPATANADVNQVICYGTSVVLNGTIGGSAATGTWSGGAGLFTPDDSTLTATYIPTAADSLAGTITLTLTSNDPAGVCASVTDAMTITINQPATVSADVNQTICYGSTVSLNGSIGGSAVNGTWSGGTGSFSPNANTLNATYTPTAVDSAFGISTLVFTTDDPTGVCPAVSDVMIITISQPAGASADVNQVICYGSSVTLNGTIGGSAATGTWSGGTGLFTPDDSTLTATYIPTAADSLAGTITLTLTSNDPSGVCPAVSDAMTITIDQPATVNANTDQIICYGSTVTLNGSIGGSATSATWNGGNGNYSPANTTPGAIYTPTVADSLAGTIILTLATNDPSGVCPALTDTMLITIAQPATVNANADQVICYGSSVTLNGSIGGSAAIGVWTGGAGTYSPNDSTLTATYTPTSADSLAGAITLTLTTDEPLGVCPALTDVMTITIYQPASVNASADQTICYGSAVALNGSIGGSAGSGVWTGGAGAYAPNDSALTATYTPSSADSLAGTITLTLTTNDPTGVCNAVTDVMTITIDQPAIVNASADQTICYGSVVTLNGSLGGSAATGTWTGGAGSFSPNNTTPGAIYTPTSADSLAGSITLTLTTDDPSGVCSVVNDVMTITISQPATANANTDQTICFGSSVNLNGAIGGSATTGTWTGGTGSFSPNNTTLGASYTPSAADSLAGSVTLTITTDDPAGTCTAVTDVMVITISPAPSIPVVSAPNYTYCQSQTVGAINASGTGTILWSNSPGMLPVINTGNTYTPGSLPAGTTIFYLLDSLTTGCKSLGTATVSVTIYSNPAVSGTPQIDSANCGFPTGGITGILVSGGTPGYTYQWYNGSTPITGANSDTLGAVGSGSYSVQVTDANGCPAIGGVSSFTVPASSSLTSTFTPSGTQGTTPFTVVFTNGSAAGSSFAWDLGNGVTSVSTTTTQTTYTAQGTYTVTLVSTNGTCIATSTLLILVEGVPSVVIPNIFSPNGDGINDQFFIQSIAITDLHTDLYNRWGTLIYTMDGVNANWDGKNAQNEDLSEGTYYVILKAKTIDGKELEKQGFVTLVR